MPHTVKLSQRFDEKFGHEVVDEMVNWFNQTDTTYRAELREFNELNFARFDAKLEQRLAQVESRLEQRLAGFESRMERRLAEVSSDLRTGMAELRGELRDELHAQGKMLMRWMVGLWMTAIGTLGGLIVAGLHFLPATRP